MTLNRARLHVAMAVGLVTLLALSAGCGGDPLAPGVAGDPTDASAYGVPFQGFPSWKERALLVLTNAVRMAPLDYRAKYAADFSPSLAAAGALDGYPATGPVRWNLGLNHSSRAHSEDMARTPCWGHNSCDGTTWSVRIGRHYTLSGSIGENIAAGTSEPRYAMNMWLCDQSGGACCADRASCDGHRRNMMNGGWQALGTGYAYGSGSPYGHYWTQDFGGVADLPVRPLVDGSHILMGGQVVFLASWSDSGAPRSMAVVLDGAPTPLALDLGVASRGTWAARLPAAAGCRSYHFTAQDAGGAAWRYPASGELRTFGDGSCAEDYRP